MPQMNPIWWFSLFILFIIHLLLSNSLNGHFSLFMKMVWLNKGGLDVNSGAFKIEIGSVLSEKTNFKSRYFMNAVER